MYFFFAFSRLAVFASEFEIVTRLEHHTLCPSVFICGNTFFIRRG
jgi:hypothetical protein